MKETDMKRWLTAEEWELYSRQCIKNPAINKYVQALESLAECRAVMRELPIKMDAVNKTIICPYCESLFGYHAEDCPYLKCIAGFPREVK